MGHSRGFRDVGCDSALTPRTDIVQLDRPRRKSAIADIATWTAQTDNPERTVDDEARASIMGRRNYLARPGEDGSVEPFLT
jgi:hypothetical protein